MPTYFHHLLPLSPPPPTDERAEVKVQQQIPGTGIDGHPFTISLLGRSHTVDAIAITMNNDTPEDRKVKRVEAIGNHLLAALRISYDASADGIRLAHDGCLNACYESDDELPALVFDVSKNINDNHVVNYHNIAIIFSEASRLGLQSVVSLIGEAALPSLPVHYRVLSLFRAFELLIPDSDRRAVYERFEDDFAAIGISTRHFRNAMPEIRNRCAHGWGNGAPAPLVAQIYPELSGLGDLAALLREIVMAVLREKHGLDLKPI